MNERREVPETDRHVLVCYDGPEVREKLSSLLRESGFEVDCASDGALALEKIRERDYTLVLAAVRMGGATALGLVRQARNLRPSTAIVLVVGKSEVNEAITAIRHGAYDYFHEPLNPEDVLHTVRRAVEKRRLERV